MPLRPCRWCYESIGVRMAQHGIDHFSLCDVCGAAGPKAPTENKAFLLHNQRPIGDVEDLTQRIHDLHKELFRLRDTIDTQKIESHKLINTIELLTAYKKLEEGIPPDD